MENKLIKGTSGDWEVVVGLEIHAQIASKSKLFSGSATTGDLGPNSRVNFFDSGMPGMLPVVNSYCIDQAIKTGFGINGEINRLSIFDRKNYFYPDLPTGYQITQFYYPIVSNGFINIISEGEKKRIGINRIHIEQDAGKCIHDISPNKSYIDFNRAGIALMEIVTDPDMRSVDEAVATAKKIHMLVQYLETSDGNMENGNFRVDANISVHHLDQPFGTRVEVKNLNSFKFMQTALEYEVERQIETLESGKKIIQETRLFDTNSGITVSMREKEDVSDYRYFPDPDLPPIILSEERIKKIKEQMPELPDEKKERFMQDFFLNEYDAEILTIDRELSEFYEAAVNFEDFKKIKNAVSCKLVANWIIGELFALMKEYNLNISSIKIKPHAFAKLVLLIQSGEISGKIAKSVFEKMWELQSSEPADIVAKLGLKQISSQEEILPVIQKIMKDNQNVVESYKAGKESVFGFFVGQVMKHFKGQANPEVVNFLLKEELTK